MSYLRISIIVMALVNGLALLFDFLVTSQISIYRLSVACVNYPLVVWDIINVYVGYHTLHYACEVTSTMKTEYQALDLR